MIRNRDFIAAKNIAKLQIVRAILKKVFCQLGNDVRLQEQALKAVDKLIEVNEHRIDASDGDR